MNFAYGCTLSLNSEIAASSIVNAEETVTLPAFKLSSAAVTAAFTSSVNAAS